MDRSKFLSKVIGIYLIIISMAMITNAERFFILINILINDAPLIFVTGFFTVILGTLMVVAHSVWEWNWRILVTLVGWVTLLKGIMILISPGYLYLATQFFTQNMTNACVAIFINFILGLALVYFGFRHEKA